MSRKGGWEHHVHVICKKESRLTESDMQVIYIYYQQITEPWGTWSQGASSERTPQIWTGYDRSEREASTQLSKFPSISKKSGWLTEAKDFQHPLSPCQSMSTYWQKEHFCTRVKQGPCRTINFLFTCHSNYRQHSATVAAAADLLHFRRFNVGRAQ